jgi:hypothetical protein
MNERDGMSEGTGALVGLWRESVREAHDARVKVILDRLEPREALILREAAVMGFVQGVMWAGALHERQVPPDREIVYRTLDGIGGFPDTYPTLNGRGPEPPREQDLSRPTGD